MARQGKNAAEIYDALSIRDVQDAADEFRPLYEITDGKDGYVSLEVNPHLAQDTDRTVEEAHRLWAELSRPNVFIKVPATEAGLPAIERLIGEGINVNVTLLFGLGRYRQVAEAYIAGIERRASRGAPIHRVASVASFFLSRIDVLVDPVLEVVINTGGDRAALARRAHGQVAIASAKLAYRMWREIFNADRFELLVANGARPQRLLWASTSTKNPDYSDVKYVDALVGPETVNTVPLETFDAYRDHGNPNVRIEDDLDQAQEIMQRLGELGIQIDDVTQQLEDEGVEKFNKPFDKLMGTLADAVSRYSEKSTTRLRMGDRHGRRLGIVQRLQMVADRAGRRGGGQDHGSMYRRGLAEICSPRIGR